MKWYRLAESMLLFCVSLYTDGQTTNKFSTSSIVQSYKLEVTTNKTCNVIFPAAITSVDRGSQDILVQKATGVENILRVKADVKDFTETNLSVITADGKLYSFLVDYSLHPDHLNITVSGVAETDSTQLIYSTPGTNKAVLAMYADSVLRKGPDMGSIHASSADFSLALDALYIHEDVMFLELILTNTSQINYDIDQLHFYICDKVKAKRTASQQIELSPMLVTGNANVIRGNSMQPLIIALQKFTIPDGKYLSIEIMEKNGGRNVSLKVKNRKIMKAKII